MIFLNFQILLKQIKQSVKNIVFNYIKKSLLKSGTSLLAHSTFKGSHSIAACYLHFAPEEKPEYPLHFVK